MKLFIDFVCDVAVAVGAAVGVGLISGKETQVFVGNAVNTVVFFVCFAFIFALFREFCRKNNCQTLADITHSCFSKGARVFTFALTLCSFVCVTTCLAGVEQCLSEVMYLSKFPLYAVVVAALCALVLLKGMSALKICNLLSVLMSTALVVALFAQGNAASGLTAYPKPYMPIVYALFTLTMSISVACRLGSKSSKRQNIVRSVTSALLISAMLVATTLLADFSKPLPTLSAIDSPLLKTYAVLTVALASVSSIVGCAYPIVEQIDNVVRDKTVSAICVFSFAVALSMFGFDFVITYGYLFVAFVGVVLVAAMLISPLREKSPACRVAKKPSPKQS